MSSLRIPPCRQTLVALACLTMLAVFGTGCGGKDKVPSGDAVLAKVGDKKITADYYEQKLARLKPTEMPRDDDGNVLDTAEPAGKRRFLDTIINKDVMVAVAKRMGFDSDPQIADAHKTLIQHEAAAAALDRFVGKPAAEVDEAEITAFHENLGRLRKCRYFITNTREDALAGRQKALAGADWAELFAEFHDGAQMPNLSYEISIDYGRFIPSFEDPIFACKIGDITEPVPSTYGWWILKVDAEEQGKQPPLEKARKTIVATIANRSKMRLLDEYKQGVRTKYQMYINEPALLKAYEGLPQDEAMFYPGTKDQVKREDLIPLKLDPADFDIDFYGYEVKGEPRKYTLGDFKTAYDRMNVFERPKWGEMLGAMRQMITDEIDRALLNFDSEDRGLHTDPDVLAKVNVRLEEMLVGKLFKDSVHSDDNITPAALDSTWALHKDDYNLPETRSGKRVICADAAQAAKARAALTAGEPWQKVLSTFGADEADKAAGGALTGVRTDAQGTERDALFSLQVGQFSEPLALKDGRFVVIGLDEITPPHSQELAAVSDYVVKRIRNKREEMAFREALDGWKAQFKIVVYEDKLSKTRSWKELTDAANQTPAVAAE
jgi:peptidyl-prolyl cis-trans isomerase C